MPDRLELSTIQLTINGQALAVDRAWTVAVAIALADVPCRTSVGGQPRGPLCGMGVCFECRATVDGIAHTRTCQLLCQPAMDIRTT